MHLLWSIISLCLIFSASSLYASDGILDFGRIATIDYLVEQAISTDLIAGAVVVIGNRNGILSSTARGRLSATPGAPLLNQQTIFDLASLTKVIATTPAVMKLLDEGHISLQAPLTRWFPEFKGTDRENVTILHLLTHTSGLSDFDVGTQHAMETAVHKAAAEKNRQRPGSSFNYADINFILLGELIQRVSGRTLDSYSRDELFTPLAIPETMFLPTADLAARIAPTQGITSGTVQDRNARRLGSVAGHAGLFSSAQDLARFARMMLSGGSLDGRQILSRQIVEQMTSPFLCSNGSMVRGLGWDMNSSFSAPKGRLFSEDSFGHTGYSGSSIWIDPKQDLFVVMLTNRRDYRNIRTFNQLRSDISTLASAEFGTPEHPETTTPRIVTRITAVPQRTATASSSAAPRRIRLLAAASETHSKAQRHSNRKTGKNNRLKTTGRSNRA